jgi:hypothetical protein
MGWIFVPLDDIGDDERSIVARLLDVADQEDDQDDTDATAGVEGHQGDAKPLPWAVRASRRLLGDHGIWRGQEDQGYGP